MHEGFDPASDARGSGTVWMLCWRGSPRPWCMLYPDMAAAEQGRGSVSSLGHMVKEGGQDEQGHRGWSPLLVTVCLQEAVSTYKHLLSRRLHGCPLLTSAPGSNKALTPISESGQPAVSCPPHLIHTNHWDGLQNLSSGVGEVRGGHPIQQV